jgi:hypothetical protein
MQTLASVSAMKRPLHILPVLLLLLGGCATPVYQTIHRHEPPVDAAGFACVQACDAERQRCQDGCRARYEACLAEIEPQVEGRFLAALERYELELRTYAQALRHYEMQLSFSWPGTCWSPRYACGWQPWGWYGWPGPLWPPPPPPGPMPTREGVRADLARQSCESDCGCLPAYDTCFTACGGTIVEERICVKNCPAPQAAATSGAE